MYTVYILLSLKDKGLYVGCTSDFKKRFDNHTKGFVPSTKLRRPLVVILEERFDDKAEAFNRERFLKSLWSARFKKKLKEKYLKDSLIK